MSRISDTLLANKSWFLFGEDLGKSLKIAPKCWVCVCCVSVGLESSDWRLVSSWLLSLRLRNIWMKKVDEIVLRVSVYLLCHYSFPLNTNLVHPKGNQSWIFTGKTDAEAETPILWLPDAKNWLLGKDPDAGKDWRQEENGDVRGWDGWMASPTQWTWVWASSGSWWWTGQPGVLQSMGSQRVGHDWVTELKH